MSDGVDPDLDEALVRLAATGRLLVALDFDGTLAPLVDDPAQSRMPAAAEAAIRELVALPETFVAYVSGRGFASLDAVTPDIPGVLAAASHGAELRLDANQPPTTPDADAGVIDALQARLEPLVAGLEGVRIERKAAGLVVHTRLADEAATARAAEAAAVAAMQFPGLTVRGGKNIIEFAASTVTKAEAVARLRQHVAATAVLFAGDDVTDEDALASLDPATDVAVKVGAGPTAAAYRIPGPGSVPELLRRLGSARRAR